MAIHVNTVAGNTSAGFLDSSHSVEMPSKPRYASTASEVPLRIPGSAQVRGS
jgi:hypothetical protein